MLLVTTDEQMQKHLSLLVIHCGSMRVFLGDGSETDAHGSGDDSG
jgi:hypothetical protein